MCGLGGCSNRAPLPEGHARELAGELSSALANRGPDGVGVHADGDLLLVHRRLSIIDLSPAGAQPLWNEDRTVCVMVNGEIYNFRELREVLIRQGHVFRSQSDCEVVPHLYEQYGIAECCERLEGMFALALWDSRSRELYLVRDRLGIKPLVISEHDEGVTFASTLPALLADARVPRSLRNNALAVYLTWGFVPSPWSAVSAARHVLPGSWLRVRAGLVVEERQWWTDRPVESATTDSDVREALDAAVRSHLVADVPVGVLLSAGVDSGLVTALATRALPPVALHAWTVSHRGFAEDEYEEAMRAARHLGVIDHEIAIGASGLTAELFDRVVRGMDEPLGVSSLVGLHQLFQAIAPDRRVILSGDGGDELFGGYNWHLGMPYVPPWAASSSFRTVAPWLGRLPRGSGPLAVMGEVGRRVSRHPASVYLDKLRICSADELRILGVDSPPDDPMEERAREVWDRFAPAGELEQMLAVDRATALVDEMLAKVDTSSMAYSVESRVPMLAEGVLRASKGLPRERKRRGETGKLCLREWYAELGPPGLAARDKSGFNSPMREWMSSPVGPVLRDWAATGVRLSGGRGSVESPRLTFACAVLGAWAEHS
ncbi:MAG: asparagine synthase (glutamine-hydrolyzing) [Gemmatimonadota bacterium]|nr:asparagine synthase (glutamine-hydrolyzing) [Gemmatimonadota bacterium]